MEGRKRLITQIMLLAAAAILILTGVVREEPGLIFQKAVRMCLECMGIG